MFPVRFPLPLSLLWACRSLTGKRLEAGAAQGLRTFCLRFYGIFSREKGLGKPQDRKLYTLYPRKCPPGIPASSSRGICQAKLASAGCLGLGCQGFKAFGFELKVRVPLTGFGSRI